MKISKSVAQYMTLAGVVGCVGISVPTSIWGIKAADISSAMNELAVTPLHQAVARLDEIAAEEEARVMAIEDCLYENKETPDTCLPIVNAFFEYVDQTQNEAVRLRTAFPESEYQAARQEMGTLTGQMETLNSNSVWLLLGLGAFASTAIAGRIAYRRREREEKAQRQTVSDLYPK